MNVIETFLVEKPIDAYQYTHDYYQGQGNNNISIYNRNFTRNKLIISSIFTLSDSSFYQPIPIIHTDGVNFPEVGTSVSLNAQSTTPLRLRAYYCKDENNNIYYYICPEQSTSGFKIYIDSEGLFKFEPEYNIDLKDKLASYALVCFSPNYYIDLYINPVFTSSGTYKILRIVRTSNSMLNASIVQLSLSAGNIFTAVSTYYLHYVNDNEVSSTVVKNKEDIVEIKNNLDDINDTVEKIEKAFVDITDGIRGSFISS